MPRQARIDYPGALHHVYGRGMERRFIFKTDQEKLEFYYRIKKLLPESDMRMYAWSIMSNHFHFILQTGTRSLAGFMRQLLTGYAVFYNKIHKRAGHVFQNRYKSIVCDKDEYLLSLIRYVHLNPVKAKIVDWSGLKRYRWTGHKELIREQKGGLISGNEVLSYFDQKRSLAMKTYAEYVREGIELDEDYMGGGLIRSMGGMSETQKLKKDDRQSYDERVLGDGDFVENVLRQVEEEDELMRVFRNEDDLLERIGKYYSVSKDEILNKRDQRVREARKVFVYLANKYLGKPASHVGKILSMKQSAASTARQKGEKIIMEIGTVKKLL